MLKWNIVYTVLWSYSILYWDFILISGNPPNCPNFCPNNPDFLIMSQISQNWEKIIEILGCSDFCHDFVLICCPFLASAEDCYHFVPILSSFLAFSQFFPNFFPKSGQKIAINNYALYQPKLYNIVDCRIVHKTSYLVSV